MTPKHNNVLNEKKDFDHKSDDDPLSMLEVFDRLEIGPVKLEPKRLVAPYRLFVNGKEACTELIYSYEETVFDSTEPGNLCQKIFGAQSFSDRTVRAIACCKKAKISAGGVEVF